MSRSVAIGVQRRARRRSRISCAGFAAVFSRFACLPIRRRYLAVQSAYRKFAGESAPHPCFKAVVLTGTICLRKPGFQGESVSPAAATKRRVFARPSIAVGNILQSGGILVAAFALRTSCSTRSTAIAVTLMLLAWALLYFSSHAIAHWLVGRAVGIRFLFYTVGGTGNPEGWPPGLRWIFEHLPFFGVQTEKLSMQNVGPGARALMWSAGVTSSAVIPTLSAFLAWRSGVPWSGWFFLFALFWALGTLASNWTSRAGDYSKARRALSHS